MPLIPRFVLCILLALAGGGALAAQKPTPSEVPPGPAAPPRTLAQCDEEMASAQDVIRVFKARLQQEIDRSTVLEAELIKVQRAARAPAAEEPIRPTPPPPGKPEKR